MKLYLIRHGESEANSTSSHAGWAQVSLTAKGEGEAREVGCHLRDIPRDKIYTSDLRRAMQTHALALPGTTAETTDLIREVNVGSLAGRRVADCTAEMGEPYLAAKRIFDFTAWGGENYAMFCTRILAFLHAVSGEEQTVFAFCHGGVIHAVLDMLFSGTLNDGAPIPTAIGIDKP
ncbi:MAG: histidine phosphatase family protein, partial [Clostridia bacterium]|nr:histidine phosphatase family protein [Clostridia bacterium]